MEFGSIEFYLNKFENHNFDIYDKITIFEIKYLLNNEFNLSPDQIINCMKNIFKSIQILEEEFLRKDDDYNDN